MEPIIAKILAFTLFLAGIAHGQVLSETAQESGAIGSQQTPEQRRKRAAASQHQFGQEELGFFAKQSQEVV